MTEKEIRADIDNAILAELAKRPLTHSEMRGLSDVMKHHNLTNFWANENRVNSFIKRSERAASPSQTINGT